MCICIDQKKHIVPLRDCYQWTLLIVIFFVKNKIKRFYEKLLNLQKIREVAIDEIIQMI